MGNKSVETLASKIRFSSVLDTFPSSLLPSPPNNVDFSISSTAQVGGCEFKSRSDH